MLINIIIVIFGFLKEPYRLIGRLKHACRPLLGRVRSKVSYGMIGHAKKAMHKSYNKVMRSRRMSSPLHVRGSTERELKTSKERSLRVCVSDFGYLTITE